MKTILASTLALALTFILGCSSDSDSNSNNSSNGGSVSSSSGITDGGSNIANLPSNMSNQVYNYSDGTTYNGNGDVKIRLRDRSQSGSVYDTLPAGTIQNGKVTLSLPENVDSKYLRDLVCDDNASVCETAENTKYENIDRIYADIPNKGFCTFWLKDSPDVFGEIALMYVSNALTLKNSYRQDFTDSNPLYVVDYNFSKGWNMYYSIRVYPNGDNHGSGDYNNYLFNDYSKHTEYAKETPVTLTWALACN